MKRTALFLLFFFSLCLAFSARNAEAVSVAGASAEMIDVNMVAPDFRQEQLKQYFDYYKSPLAEYAGVFVEMADKYNIDWKLLPAISGVESTFARHYINGTYNAYGWGGGKIQFESWEDSIEKVSKALSEKYYSRGLDTPAKIAPVYCPPSKVWAGNVNFFMEKLEGFKEQNILKTQLILSL